MADSGAVPAEVPAPEVLGEADARIFELGQILGVCESWDSAGRAKL